MPSLYLLLNDIRRAGRWALTGEWPTREEVEPACRDALLRAARQGAAEESGLEPAQPEESTPPEPVDEPAAPFAGPAAPASTPG